MVRDFGRESRNAARRPCGPDLRERLDRDLDEARRDVALEEAIRVLGERAGELDAFRHACEELIENAMEERGFELDIQALADVATLAPLVGAAAIVFTTGGVGVDLAILGGGAVSTLLMEKYSHLLGSGILAAARRRWSALRGRTIAGVLSEACLPESFPALRVAVEKNETLVTTLAATRIDRRPRAGTLAVEAEIA